MTTPSTLDADLRNAAVVHAAREAVVAGATRVTFAELDRRVDALAGELLHLGVGRGDRVAVVIRNSVEAAAAIYAILRAGAAFVPLSPTAKQDRLSRVMEHSGAAAVVCEADTAHRLRRGAPWRPVLRVGSDDSWGGPAPHGFPAVLDVDLAAVLYTSGSTGEPKGAVFLHRNMHFVAGSMVEFLGLHADDRILSVLPLSHTYGLYQLIMAVRTGATLVLEERMTLPGRIVRTLENERITVLPGVPTLWHVLTSLRGLDERVLPDLRLLTNAGAALPVARLEAMRRVFPAADIIPIYGQTECKSACYLPAHEVRRRPGSVGVALPGTSLRLEGEDGKPVRPGEVGELIVRGDHIMQGYWRDTAGTARALSPGRWPGDRELRSGDLFRSDEDGFLYFVARKDDIIISRGEKVAPREVEEVLQSAQGVRDSAVVGVPDDLRGSAVVAHVCPTDGYLLQPQQLRRHCAEHLEDVMVPSAIFVHDDLPRLDNGKVDRLALVALGVRPHPRHTRPTGVRLAASSAEDS